MALSYKILLFLLATVFIGACSGATASDAVYRAGVVYNVGDSKGWGILVDYDDWSSTKEFHVGDTLIFNYDNKFLDLMQVNEQDYLSCNTKFPLAFYVTGSDVINLKKPGDYYFIGGRNFEPEWYAMTLKDPTYCNAGQKLHVRVSSLIPKHQTSKPKGPKYQTFITRPSPPPPPPPRRKQRSVVSSGQAPPPNHHPVSTSNPAPPPSHHLVVSPSPAPTPNSLHHGQPTSTNSVAPGLGALSCLFIPLISLLFLL